MLVKTLIYNGKISPNFYNAKIFFEVFYYQPFCVPAHFRFMSHGTAKTRSRKNEGLLRNAAISCPYVF